MSEWKKGAWLAGIFIVAYFLPLGNPKVTNAILEGFRLLCDTEGIIPALEPAHAIYYATKMTAELPQDQLVIVNLSGRGDKDLEIVTKELGTGL